MEIEKKTYFIVDPGCPFEVDDGLRMKGLVESFEDKIIPPPIWNHVVSLWMKGDKHWRQGYKLEFAFLDPCIAEKFSSYYPKSRRSWFISHEGI